MPQVGATSSDLSAVAEARHPTREPIPSTLEAVIADIEYWSEELARCRQDSIRHAAIESRLERLAYRRTLLVEEQPLVTALLQRAMHEAAKLPASEQNALARAMLDMIAAHHRGVLASAASH